MCAIYREWSGSGYEVFMARYIGSSLEHPGVPPTPLTSIATKSSSEKREASGAVSHQRGRMVAASLSFPLLLLLHLASPAPAADAKEVAQVHNPALGEVVQVGRAYPLHNVVSQSSQVVPPPTGDGGKGETKRAALLLDKIMFAVQKVIMTIFIITTRA